MADPPARSEKPSMDAYSAFVTVEEGTSYPFSSWPNAEVPKVCAGIYTIWEDRRLMYAGMAGRALSEEQIAAARRVSPERKKGLFDRLGSHASGQRSGNQFCLYVYDRLVLPELSREAIGQIGEGTLNPDTLVRAYIHNHLSYRFAEVKDSYTAIGLEQKIRNGDFKAGKPFLNPTRSR